MNTKLVAATAAIFLLLCLIIVSPSLPLFDGANLNKNFTIAVLPDTQGYVEYHPWLLDSQTQWIADNKESLNIVFVTQLGDLVGDSTNLTMWEIANTSMSKLDGNVPWAVLPGNHDQTYGSYAHYSTYFGSGRFSDESWYGGTYPSAGDNTNSYQMFSACGDDYLIFHLQYNPSDDVLYWASNIIDQHPDSRVIVATHDYIMGPMNCDRRSDIGERVWHSLIKQHADQIFLVLCGHASTQSLITDTVNGNVVYQMLADFQNSSNIESGWLRLLTFYPSQNRIIVKTYSPYLDEYNTDPANDYTLDYNMTGASKTAFGNLNVSQIAFVQSLSQVRFEVSAELFREHSNNLCS